jgi:hypothetical protein
MKGQEQTGRNGEIQRRLKQSAGIGEGLVDIAKEKRIRADWQKWRRKEKYKNSQAEIVMEKKDNKRLAKI